MFCFFIFDKILCVVLKLFECGGVEVVSMCCIVDVVGIMLMVIYCYFFNCEVLFKWLFDDSF